MNRFFTPNLNSAGRWTRAFLAAGLLGGAWFAFDYEWWAGLLLALLGAFVLWEALSGWCGLRACGIRTRI